MAPVKDAPAQRAGMRIEYIDGLRALAVLSVVAFHATVGTATNGWAHFISLQGCHGVDLFFVLSGFCLAYPTLQRAHQGDAAFDWTHYAARRLVRIVPPYYIALALLIAAFLIFGRVPGAMPGITGLQILKQFLFVDRGTSFLNPSFWTLPIEFRWYFLFPFALWLWTRSPRAFLVSLIGVGLLMGSAYAPADLIVLPGFLLGIVAADLRTRCSEIAWLALPASLIMFAACLAFFPNRTGHGEVGPAWEIASFFLVVAAGAVPALQRMLSVKGLVSIGVASYGIYLVHQPVIDLAETIGWRPPLAAFAGIGAGLLFWWCAERPFTNGRPRTVLLRHVDALGSAIAAHCRLRRRFSVGGADAPERPREMAA
ncbi:MAG TPA: acyltransferase [Candidatus Rubrimentiphilum sp.]|nr:acyltransferase [Candidatus Rubrimentiphilum sp.]